MIEFCVTKYLLILELRKNFSSQQSLCLQLQLVKTATEYWYNNSREGKNEWPLVYKIAGLSLLANEIRYLITLNEIICQ